MFRIFKKRAASALGHLEIAVMEILWAQGESSVRDVIQKVDRPLAYTTVMTTLDRLYKKGLLDRVAEGRAFRYTPRHTSEELQRVTALESIVQLLRSGSPSPLPLSYLVEALSAHDEQLLDELQLLVERKRRELGDRETKKRTTRDGEPG